MTIADLAPVIDYLDDGVTADFPVPFRFLAPTDIVATRNAAGVATVLAYGADYHVSGGATDAGGTLTLITHSAGATLRIERSTARAQTADYQTNDNFPAETHEGVLDKLMAIDQEQDAGLADIDGRAFRVAPGEVANIVDPVAVRSGYLAAWDQVGRLSQGPSTGAAILAIAAAIGGTTIGKIGILPSVAAMRAMLKAKLADGDHVLLSGYYTAGDIGGGIFHWSAASTATVDGGSVIAAAEGGNGRWLRALDAPSLRPEHFGYVSGDGQDIAPFLVAAQAIFAPFGGGTCDLSNGVYKWSGVTITQRNMTIFAQGATITRFGAGVPVLRAMFVMQLIGARFRLIGGSWDLNGEGPYRIGEAGRIPNSYAASALAGRNIISGPANALIYALRSSQIYVLDVEGVANSGENLFLFRNCGDVYVVGKRGQMTNAANCGIEFTWPTDDHGAGPMPVFRNCVEAGYDWSWINDFSGGAANGVAILYGGGCDNIAITGCSAGHGSKFDRNARAFHVEFNAPTDAIGVPIPGGTASWLEKFDHRIITSNDGQDGGAWISVKYGTIYIQATDAGGPLAGALSSNWPSLIGANVTGGIELDFTCDIRDTKKRQFIKRADGVTTGGVDRISSASSAFTAADIGLPIAIEAGTSTAPAVAFETEIIAIISPTIVQTRHKVPRSVAAGNFAYGSGTREGLRLVSNSGGRWRGKVIGGTASGLPGEPAAACVTLTNPQGLVDLDIRGFAPTPGNAVRHPTGLALSAPDAAAKIDHRKCLFSGFAANLVGTEANRANIVGPVRQIEFTPAFPAAGVGAYGAPLVLLPSRQYFGLVLYDLGFANMAVETVTATVTMFYADGAAPRPHDFTATANQTVRGDLLALTDGHRQDGEILRVECKVKSSIAGSAASVRFSAIATQE